jgi:hypothetical protein
MELNPGTRWRSAVCDAELVIVRPPRYAAALQCGGAPVIPHSQSRPEGGVVDAEHAAGTAVGKRFTDPESGMEVLCTKPGAGSLAVDGRPLAANEAKKLPSSD